jgi:hypothetical protein
MPILPQGASGEPERGLLVLKRYSNRRIAMKRLIPLAVAALALGACSTPPQTGGPARTGPNVVTNVHPYMAGNGTIQSVSPAPAVNASASAAAGSSSEPLQRLEIKMDNGSIQYVDTPSRDFRKGMRVNLSPDRFIKQA